MHYMLTLIMTDNYFPKQEKFSEETDSIYILQVSAVSGLTENSWILIFPLLPRLLCCIILIWLQFVKKNQPFCGGEYFNSFFNCIHSLILHSNSLSIHFLKIKYNVEPANLSENFLNSLTWSQLIYLAFWMDLFFSHAGFCNIWNILVHGVINIFPILTYVMTQHQKITL